MFTDQDQQQFTKKGIDKDQINRQIKNFENGFPYAKLTDAAIPDNGLLQFSDAVVDNYISYYNASLNSFDILKFVPASGAASRMFKDLFELKEALERGIDLKTLNSKTAMEFIDHMEKFAFYDALAARIKKDGLDIHELMDSEEYTVVLDYLLSDIGLDYAKLPKGLLYFHKYKEGARLALEEHLVEGANYAKSSDDIVRIHFTISPEHKSIFQQEVHELINKYGEKFGVKYDISFSEQKASTDTIAVDMNNKPFRELDGSIIFRPGGHGALLENLNDLDADIVFVKNIDNVVPDHLRKPTITYKKVIGAHLLKLQIQLFEYLGILDNASFTEEDFQDIIQFVRQDLMIPLGDEFEGLNMMEKVDYLFIKMNRPIRVCGMVKNEGEPGGGPFWVESNQEISLQIVEGSQIDLSNENQKNILENATHFNPVDLVCGLKDFRGNSFDLLHFVDPNTGFISIKSKNGRELKAQELPGLWNGAMADWISLFVEVPIETFNPVKTVNDLLRPQHQS